MEWSVLVETKAPEGADVGEEDILELLGEMGDALIEYGAAVGGGPDGWDVRLSIDTEPGRDAGFYALTRGGTLILEYADKVGLPAWPVIRTEAVEAETFHAELEVTNFPDMLGTTE